MTKYKSLRYGNNPEEVTKQSIQLLEKLTFLEKKLGKSKQAIITTAIELLYWQETNQIVRLFPDDVKILKDIKAHNNINNKNRLELENAKKQKV